MACHFFAYVSGHLFVTEHGLALCPILLKDTRYRALLLFIVRDREKVLEIPPKLLLVE